MLAIAGGLGAALVFAIVTLCNARSSRIIGPQALLGWIMVIGLVILAPVAIAGGIPAGLDARAGAWMAVSGIGDVVGLLLAYSALRAGKVGVVAPLVSTQGAIAAVIAVLAGEPLAEGAAPLLAAIALGVFLAGAAHGGGIESGAVPGGEAPGGEVHGRTHRLRASGFALGAALAIGASLYAIGQVSVALPVVWALLPSRVLGVLVMTFPVALRGGLRMTRAAAPFVLIAGGGEVLGFALFAFGSRHGIAVTAVLSSLFSALAALGAYLLFRELLNRTQLTGIALLVAAVATLSGIQAA